MLWDQQEEGGEKDREGNQNGYLVMGHLDQFIGHPNQRNIAPWNLIIDLVQLDRKSWKEYFSYSMEQRGGI